jgi:hypothetical protein
LIKGGGELRRVDPDPQRRPLAGVLAKVSRHDEALGLVGRLGFASALGRAVPRHVAAGAILEGLVVHRRLTAPGTILRGLGSRRHVACKAAVGHKTQKIEISRNPRFDQEASKIRSGYWG